MIVLCDTIAASVAIDVSGGNGGAGGAGSGTGTAGSAGSNGDSGGYVILKQGG